MSKIKGGGRAVLSGECQEAIIDLLLSIDGEKSNGTGIDMANLSPHDKKHKRKQFMKKLVRRHERLQLKRRYGAATASKNPVTLNNSNTSSSNKLSESTSQNVRVELAEAVFRDSDKQKKDRKTKEKEGKSKSKKQNDSLKLGTKKVVVVPRSLSIPDLLKLSQSKLKLKKKPVCAFLQPSSSVLFELKNDLESVSDGTMIYVSAAPLPVEQTSCDTSDDGDDEEIDITDPLESVKRVYERQEMHRRQQTCTRIDEVVDETKKYEHAEARSNLPAAAQEEFIIETISNNEVVILSGSTGSGKSTQIPQFILDNQDQYDTKRPYIVVTQPRRVAAISLAQRVANERGCPPPGMKGSSVGYTVRLDNQVDLRSCRIVYMTIGILLRMLVQHKPLQEELNPDDNVAPPVSIDTISHLVVDEVHEREVNTDFVLTLLKKRLMASNAMPRLVIMSATASIRLFVNYFTIADRVLPASINIPGRSFDVTVKWLSDCEKFTGKRMIRRQSVEEERTRSNSSTEKGNGGILLSPCAKDRIDNEFIRELISKIIQQHQLETVGSVNVAILVFLPGLGEINALAHCLRDKDSLTGDQSICNILTLHSTTPKNEQSRIFQTSTRIKIILSTNIAETSLTIPDIKHVIDTCLVKESRYNSESRIKELITVWSSQASLSQRTGRAGRTSHGICWRLCSEDFADKNLLQHTLPEIVRTPLDELILQVCLLYEQRRDLSHNTQGSQFAGVTPMRFLLSTPTPPSKKNHNQACHHLHEVGALDIVDCGGSNDDCYRLTPLGYHISKLPTDAKIGKLLIIGCVLGCLDNALTIAAALSCSKSCFVRSSRDRQLDPNRIEARDNLIMNGFGGTVKGDLIAVVAVFRSWQTQSNRSKFCWEHALDSFTMQHISLLRHQFRGLLVDAGLVVEANDTQKNDPSNIANDDALLTTCCLVAGLYPNVCTLIRDSKSGKLLTKENEACQPSSDSFQRKRVKYASQTGRDAYAVYHAKYQTIGVTSEAQNQPRIFLSEVNFVNKFTLLLFGGDLELANNALIVDGWLKFKVDGNKEKSKGGDLNNAVLILSLRKIIDDLILKHVEQMIMVDIHKRTIDTIRLLIAQET